MEKMTRKEAIELWNFLYSLKGTYSKYLYYSIEKTKANLKPEIDSIIEKEKTFGPSDEIRLFEQTRMNLLSELCVRDQEGKPVIIEDNGLQRFELGENKAEYERRYFELMKINEPHINKYNQNQAEYHAYLSEYIDVNVVKVDFKYLPDELTRDQTDMFMRLVKDFDD